MKIPRLIRFLLCQLVLAPSIQSGDTASRLSPDGRFRFEAFSSAEVDAGEKPAFGIVETATGMLASDPAEELGDAARPEETILWAPDSLSYALTTRVGTRHLDTYLYRWGGTSFVRASWEGDARMEELADAAMSREIESLGLPEDTGSGQIVRGDDLAERWLDPSRLVLTCILESVVGSGDREAVVGGASRVLAKWDPATSSYRIDCELPVRPAWPVAVEDAGSYEVTQSDRHGDDPSARVISIRHRESGESRTFESENWLTAPVLLESANDWPQLELVSRGPAEFLMRRLYRFVDGGYRCVRVDELTRLESQAPEAAQRVEIGPGDSAFFLRSRVPEKDGTDTYESFQTESTSPDGRWKAVLTYHPQYLQRAEILAADGSAEPEILYDFDSGEGGIDTVASVRWSPDGSAFALYLQDGPRAGHTLLHRLVEGRWTQTATPEVTYEFLGNREIAATWGARLEKPLWWNGPRELVLELSGHFRGDDSFDYRALATLAWYEAGKPVSCRTVPQLP